MASKLTASGVLVEGVTHTVANAAHEVALALVVFVAVALVFLVAGVGRGAAALVPYAGVSA